MKILREAYTQEEIQQRVTDTRNIISALIDSLYILSSSLENAEVKEDNYDSLARYTNTYIRDMESFATDFYDDFEEIIEGPQEEEFEEEEEIEVEEAFQVKPWNDKYDGYNIRMDNKNLCYNIYKDDEMIDSGFKSVEAARAAIDNLDENLTEDTEKIKDGKWVNKGDTGETHGTFKTKKEADAQRKAIFASGWKK